MNGSALSFTCQMKFFGRPAFFGSGFARLFADVVARQLAGGVAADDLLHRLFVAGARDLHQHRLVGDARLAAHGADAIGDFVDRQRLGDRRARLADDLRDLLVRVAEFLLQHVEAFRLFERRQVLALDVLDQRDLELLLVVDVELDGRDLVESGQRRGAEAALAGDDLVAVRADRRGPGSARARPSRGSTPPAPRCCRAFVRGCSAFGSMNSSGIIDPMCRPERRVSSSTKCASWRIEARSGNPRFMLIGLPQTRDRISSLSE